MSLESFLSALDTRSDAPIFLLSGKEAWGLRQARLAVRRAVLGMDAGAVQERMLAGAGLSENDLRFALASADLFCARTLLALELEDKDRARLSPVIEEWLDHPAPGIALLLVAPGIHATMRLYKRAEKAGIAAKIDPPKGRELTAWLERELRARHARDPALVPALIDRVGKDRADLEAALEKLSQAAPDGAAWNAGLVAAQVARGAEAAIWDLTDSLLARDGRRAMQITHDLLREGGASPPVPMWVMMIAREVGKLWTLKELLRQGRSEADAAKEAGVMPWKARECAAVARKTPYRELRARTALLAEADAASKRSAAPAELLFTSLVAKLCRS